MSNIVFWRVFLSIAIVLTPSSLSAAQGQGDIGASIVSLKTLDIKTLKKICKEDPNTIACELYQEKKLDRKTNKKRSYSVYTANFQ